MLQNCDPYYRTIPYAIGDSTKQELLDIALTPDAFIDISYKISFFKLPSTIQKFNWFRLCMSNIKSIRVR